VRLEVTGAAEPGDGELMVRVDVANRGSTDAPRLDVQGELLGHHAEGNLASGVAAGGTQSVWLHFPVRPSRPGVHAVALRLGYPVPDASEPESHAAFLLLALGADVPPALRLSPGPAVFETSGRLPVRVESADGRAHTARVRVVTPRGLNALEEPVVEVPASGAATVQVPLLRTGPSRDDLLGLVVLASTAVDGRHGTVAATADVRLVPYRPLLPRLRPAIVAAGVLLVLAAVAAEVRFRLKR
jgi:hypothetical protein